MTLVISMWSVNTVVEVERVRQMVVSVLCVEAVEKLR